MADPDGVFRAKLDLASFGDHRRHILSTLRLAGPVEDIAEAARDEKTPAFIDAETGESITYAEYKSNIALLAAALAWPFAGHAALPPRSVVALNLPNSIHTPVILHAVLLAGHVAALVSPSLTKDEAKFQIEKCGARLVVTDGSLWNVGVAAVNSIDESKRPHMVLLSRPNGVSAAGAIPTLRDLLEYGKSRPPFVFTPLTPETAQTTPAVIPFSSGTSGLPKAVLLSHSNQSASILQISSTMRPALGWTPGNNVRYIVSFQPLAHVYGLNYTLGMAMHLRCTIVIMRSFDLTRYLTLVSRYQPRVLFLVPPVVVRLIGTPKKEFEGHDLRSVRYIFCGAAPMRKETEDSLVSLFPNRVDVKQGYGMSEMSTMLRCTLDAEFPGGSVGTLSPSTEIIVVSPDGKRLGANEEGEFWVRGPNRSVGYLDDPSASRDAIVFLDDRDTRGPDGLDWTGRGFLKTGDVGYFDSQGRGFITDRLKELIKVNALQVAPSELESLLLLHPRVVDAAVIPVPSDRFGEVPKAFIVPRGGPLKPGEAEEIVEFVAGKTAPYKRIRGGIEELTEIPKSGNGKVLRRVLKDREREKGRGNAKL